MAIKFEKRRNGIFIDDRIVIAPKKEKGLEGHNKPADPAELLRAFKKTILDSVLSCYEAEARAKLAERGFKFRDTRKAYLTAASKSVDQFTLDLLTILFRAAEVRANVSNKKASAAAWNAIELCRAAERAEIRPIVPHIRRGLKTLDASSKGGRAAKQFHQERHDQWLKHAAAIRAERATYSAWRIAGELADRYKGDAELAAQRDTIYRIIK